MTTQDRLTERIAELTTESQNLQQQCESIDKQMLLLQNRKMTLMVEFYKTDGALTVLSQILAAEQQQIKVDPGTFTPAPEADAPAPDTVADAPPSPEAPPADEANMESVLPQDGRRVESET